MKKLIAPAVFILVIAVIYSVVFGWDRFDCPKGGFSIKFPKEPLETEFPDPTDKLDDKLYLCSVSHKECVYQVMYSKLKAKKRNDIDLNAFFQAGALGGVFRQGMGTVGFKRKEISLDTYPGVEINAHMQQGGVNVKARARFYFVDGQMYVIMAMGKKSDYSSWNAGRFLNSFKLLEE
jgi:hypothetical protein